MRCSDREPPQLWLGIQLRLIFCVVKVGRAGFHEKQFVNNSS